VAIIRFGGIVTDARGKLGGVVLSANKSGSYAKPWRMPTSKPLKNNTWQTSIFSSMGHAWNALTSTQRAQWDAWAADPAQEKTNPIGEAYYLSGWQSFVEINVRLNLYLRAARTVPPTSTAPAAPALTALAAYETGAGSNTTLSFVSGQFTSYDFIAYAALVNSVGVLNAAPTWIVAHRAYAFAGSTIDLQAALEAKFGLLREGQKLLLMVYRQDTQGMRSAASSIQADVSS